MVSECAVQVSGGAAEQGDTTGWGPPGRGLGKSQAWGWVGDKRPFRRWSSLGQGDGSLAEAREVTAVGARVSGSVDEHVSGWGRGSQQSLQERRPPHRVPGEAGGREAELPDCVTSLLSSQERVTGGLCKAPVGCGASVGEAVVILELGEAYKEP